MHLVGPYTNALLDDLHLFRTILISGLSQEQFCDKELTGGLIVEPTITSLSDVMQIE